MMKEMLMVIKNIRSQYVLEMIKRLSDTRPLQCGAGRLGA